MIKSHFHVLCPPYPVKSDASFKAGQVLMVDPTTQKVTKFDGTAKPIGLSADDKGTLTPLQFTNRVSDYGDETIASGMVSVYRNGGEFYVDFTDCIVDASLAVGDILVADDSTGKLVKNNAATTQFASPYIVATVVDILSDTNGYLATGIPNEYEPAGYVPGKGIGHDSPRKWVKIALAI